MERLTPNTSLLTLFVTALGSVPISSADESPANGYQVTVAGDNQSWRSFRRRRQVITERLLTQKAMPMKNTS